MKTVTKGVFKSCLEECASFQVSLKVFNKFEMCWAKMEISDFQVEKACVDKLKKLAWLVYITASSQILGVDGLMLDKTYLALSVLGLVATNSNHSGSGKEVDIQMVNRIKERSPVD